MSCLFSPFQFTEKKREMKQDGRTDKELVESYCFLMPDPSKVGGPVWDCLGVEVVQGL